ncbi:helix-turn-helix transcriptional regulator, partial [Intestinimonas butyriciproducens]
ERTEAQRRYREAHKEEIAEGKRELRDARIALGLTQKQAAELLGVAQSTVCYWETISPPKNWREMIEKLTEPA